MMQNTIDWTKKRDNGYTYHDIRVWKRCRSVELHGETDAKICPCISTEPNERGAEVSYFDPSCFSPVEPEDEHNRQLTRLCVTVLWWKMCYVVCISCLPLPMSVCLFVYLSLSKSLSRECCNVHGIGVLIEAWRGATTSFGIFSGSGRIDIAEWMRLRLRRGANVIPAKLPNNITQPFRPPAAARGSFRRIDTIT